MILQTLTNEGTILCLNLNKNKQKKFNKNQKKKFYFNNNNNNHIQKKYKIIKRKTQTENYGTHHFQHDFLIKIFFIYFYKYFF